MTDEKAQTGSPVSAASAGSTDGAQDAETVERGASGDGVRARGPIVVAYGGGLNSTALLCGMVERGLPVDLILFADTGGELPETYAYVEAFSEWLVARGYPEIVTVRSPNVTLEEDCLNRGSLPALAFGFKTCSRRFKAEPQDKYVNNWHPAREAWERGGRVIKLIGYDAGESHRIKDYDDPKFVVRYPLVEWRWARAECRAAVERAGLCPPTKSACFFCPARRKHEVLALAREHPDLMERAIAIEDAAENGLTEVKGLGRRYAWRDLVAADEAQHELFPDAFTSLPCGCFDGAAVEDERAGGAHHQHAA